MLIFIWRRKKTLYEKCAQHKILWFYNVLHIKSQTRISNQRVKTHRYWSQENHPHLPKNNTSEHTLRYSENRINKYSWKYAINLLHLVTWHLHKWQPLSNWYVIGKLHYITGYIINDEGGFRSYKATATKDPSPKYPCESYKFSRNYYCKPKANNVLDNQKIQERTQERWTAHNTSSLS